MHFPLLPLEALSLRLSPSAVVARGRIVVADQAARLAGVEPGVKLSTALGLLPGLRVFERDQAVEAGALHDLACWAGRFTPAICLVPPSALLLEIGGCLRLFGGWRAIVDAVVAGCQAQGWQVNWGLAPTPLAARWLAVSGVMEAADGEEQSASRADLPGQVHPSLLETSSNDLDDPVAGWQKRLASLPLAVTGWPAEVLARLNAYGLRRLGELDSLPLAGLRRRIGSALVDEWLRALGAAPDPQAFFAFPEQFSAFCELPSRVDHAEGLIFAGQRLLAAMVGWLQVRQSNIRACSLHLTHDEGQVSVLPLHLAEACADESRLLRLLREHLGRLQLVGPVEALRLTADEVIAWRGDSGQLFAEAAAGEGTSACVERLQARLGEQAVQVLAMRADHRPECATQTRHPLAVYSSTTESTASSQALRPLWLLPEPQALVARHHGPHWHGPLQLLTRAERLESGWWDQGEAVGDQRRDYFVARNPQGQIAWIYRDAQGWFLHGLFS